jgi:hypothetical protein
MHGLPDCLLGAPLALHPGTGASIEVFYADRSLETFGGSGAGWFWWSRRRGCRPRFAYWPICHELCSISARDDYGGADRSMTARTFGEQDIAFHVPNVGHGAAGTGCYGLRKPTIVGEIP